MRPPLPALMLLAASLLGCATPRYQTVYRYEPPAEPAGRTCLERCERELMGCQDRCQAVYQACLKGIEPEARNRHEDALKRYEGELAQYRRDLDRYQLSLSLGWGHGPWWYGHGGYGWHDPWWPYGGYGPHYYPPLPPVPPSYAEEFARLRAEKCDRDCGCQPAYDACFLGCGGRKVPEERCIANCPPGP